ncbi:MAG: type II methionyl aminopeptidase [Candidatus Diapherotrites archaeon]|nr:type II methionyl aminopeptidase [Candidatus Diapherotrites archaeon]
MEPENEKAFIASGHVLKQAQDHAREIISVGSKLLDVAEELEAFMARKGAPPAFPVNLSRNFQAAHYSPSLDDKSTVEKNDVLKVDMGVHINGCVTDAAFTLDFSGKWSEMIQANEAALAGALKITRAGTTLHEIGSIVEKTIRGAGFAPIQNLCGHGIAQWHTHFPPSLPSIANNNPTPLEAGNVYALEPFACNGKGMVHDGGVTEIFQLEENAGAVRNETARKILAFVEKNYSTLPFAERWIARELNISGFQRKVGMRELLQKQVIRPHPVLVEDRNVIVTQAETSILIKENEVIPLIQ